jgi:hypothetical protein
MQNYIANCAVCGGPGDPECPCEGKFFIMQLRAFVLWLAFDIATLVLKHAYEDLSV